MSASPAVTAKLAADASARLGAAVNKLRSAAARLPVGSLAHREIEMALADLEIAGLSIQTVEMQTWAAAQPAGEKV